MKPFPTQSKPEQRQSLISRKLFAISALAVISFSASSNAQLPIMIIDDARVFEGNAGGGSVLRLPVRFVGVQNTTVSGFVSVIPLPGAGFAAATGGATCDGNVDFEQFSNVPFTIPPNTANGTLSVNIQICGDNVIEPDESVFVFLSGVTGADISLEGVGNAVGTIVNDDGPPAIQINNISASTVQGVSRTATFTVSLHHPSPVPVSVNFRTRDGTARARTISSIGSYIPTSGTLVIPTNTLSATIPVTILGTGGGTFFMDLTSPVNGTLLDATGQCTITIRVLTIGSFDLSSNDDSVTSGEIVKYALTWSAPEGEVWRDISTLDFRLSKGNKPVLWAQWEEPGNTITVCQQSPAPSLDLICSEGALPGSGSVLETDLAELILSESSVVGSGPTGQTVTLNLAVRFKEGAAGNYNIEIAGEDDFGDSDDFFTATKVHVGNNARK